MNNTKSKLRMAQSEELSNYIEELVYHMKVTEQANPCDRVSLQEIQVISFLGHRGKAKMSDIADYLMLGLSNLTAITDKLVAKKLVVRSRSEEDRRIVFVSLTKEGREIFQKNREQKHDLAGQMLNALDTIDQDKLMTLMKTIVLKLKST